MISKKTTLKNGLSIVTIPMKDNPTVTVMVLVRAGSKYETKEINGISHFLEHMCFKGTKKRPNTSDISRELDSVGAVYNAFTSQEYTGYFAKADHRHTDLILDVVSDLYLNPIFDEKEMEKEKGVIVQEIAMYEDMPQRHVQDVFMELLYGDQPAGWNIAGTKELVKSYTKKQLLEYRNAHYVASATTVVVAGKFDEKKIIEGIKKHFAGVSSSKKKDKKRTKESQKDIAVHIKDKKTDQSHLVYGYRAFDFFDKRNPIISVLVTVLGRGMSSRLFQKLRDEMGVAYYVGADGDAYSDHGVISVSAGVDKERLNESVKAIAEEYKKLKTELVPDEELRKAKDYIIGRMYLGLESSDDLADFYGFQELLKGERKTPENKAKEIEKVTAKEIRDIAKKLFVDNKANIAIVGDVKDGNSLYKAIKL